MKNSIEYVDECVGLLKQVKTAWDEIRPVIAKPAAATVATVSP